MDIVWHLVGVDESFANGESIGLLLGRFQVDADEGAGHRRIAGKEQRPSLVDESRVAIAHSIDAQVGTAVAHSHHDRRRITITLSP